MFREVIPARDVLAFVVLLLGAVCSAAEASLNVSHELGENFVTTLGLVLVVTESARGCDFYSLGFRRKVQILQL